MSPLAGGGVMAYCGARTADHTASFIFSWELDSTEMADVAKNENTKNC